MFLRVGIKGFCFFDCVMSLFLIGFDFLIFIVFFGLLVFFIGDEVIWFFKY